MIGRAKNPKPTSAATQPTAPTIIEAIAKPLAFCGCWDQLYRFASTTGMTASRRRAVQSTVPHFYSALSSSATSVTDFLASPKSMVVPSA